MFRKYYVADSIEGGVRGFEPRCFKRRWFKRVLYCMIRSLPRQGQIPCISRGCAPARTSDFELSCCSLYSIVFLGPIRPVLQPSTSASIVYHANQWFLTVITILLGPPILTALTYSSWLRPQLELSAARVDNRILILRRSLRKWYEKPRMLPR
jgi:hypothetical protein